MTIIRPDELLPEVTALYRAGLPRGFSTGWPSVDEYYTVARGQWTLLTGIPGHGKSEWLDALLMNLAEQRRDDMHSWRFAIFSPENQPHELHVAKLLEKRLRKPFGAGPSERMSEREMLDAAAKLRHSFAFIKTERPTLAAILQDAQEWAYTLKGPIRDMPLGLVIDPWNEVEHWRDVKYTETEYLSTCLSQIRQFSREINGHVWVVAHPKLLLKDGGNYPVPTPYDVSGGAHWRNKADCCICVWRDVESELPMTQIHVQKVRFKHIGKPGMVELRYEKVTGRYSDPNAESATRQRYARASNGGD
jgi:twinkle protein